MDNSRRSLRPAAVAASCGVLLTLLVSLSPTSRFAYLAPALHVAIEMSSGFAVLLAAYLVYGRFRHSRRLTELLLVVAFVLFGFANLVLFALPTAVGGERPAAAVLWAGLFARLLGALVLAVAALAPNRQLRDPAAAGRLALGGCLGVFAICGIALARIEADAAVLVATPASTPPLAMFVPTTLHALQLVGVALFASAAAGFVNRVVRAEDELFAWLATASVLAAFAWANYFLFPSLYSDWISTGDLLRFGFYIVVLFASAREIRRYWQRIAEVEVLEERRRLARELHDGVAQELAFIARRTRRGGGLDAAVVGEIAAAADRGRTEARRAVRALSGTTEEPFEVALAQAVEHVASRAGTPVRCLVSPGTDPPRAAQEDLIRIACEAVSNAVRHGHPSAVTVELTGSGGEHRLRVVDDGAGFVPTAPPHTGSGGFGLRIMRERAARLGADLELVSRPGAGTEVVVVMPAVDRRQVARP